MLLAITTANASPNWLRLDGAVSPDPRCAIGRQYGQSSWLISTAPVSGPRQRHPAQRPPRSRNIASDTIFRRMTIDAVSGGDPPAGLVGHDRRT
jgi:hypothetical protein